MAKDVYETYGLGNDIEPILPDGWSEGDDIFADATSEKDIFEADGSEDTGSEAGGNEAEDEGALELLTTEQTDAGEGLDAEDAEEETEVDGPGEPATPPSRILKLKVNHNEYEVDVNGLSDEELIARLQKADAFDAMKDEQMKAKFREVYDEQIAQGMTEGVAKMVATNACNGKMYSLEDEVVEETPAAPAAPSESHDARDFKAQVKQLKSVYPDFKAMPDEVMQAYANGADLLSAYSAYRVRESEQAAKSIKKENRILKQNAASAAKAPVKGVTGGGPTDQKKEDPFLKGFDSDNW